MTFNLEALSRSQFVRVDKISGNGLYAIMPGMPLEIITDRFDLNPGNAFISRRPLSARRIIDALVQQEPKPFSLLHRSGKQESLYPYTTALKMKSWDNRYLELNGKNYLVSLYESLYNPFLWEQNLTVMDVGKILGYDQEGIDFPLARQADDRNGEIEIGVWGGLVKANDYWRALISVSGGDGGKQKGELVLASIDVINSVVRELRRPRSRKAQTTFLPAPKQIDQEPAQSLTLAPDLAHDRARRKLPEGFPFWRVIEPQLQPPLHPSLPPFL